MEPGSSEAAGGVATRHFGSITTAIWDDEDWWELDGEQQRVYLMLVTQKDITSVGTLPLTLKRWASSTRGCTIEGLSNTLQELADAFYIIVDWRRELLLVRSFVRWDKGYNNEKRLKSIQSTALTVTNQEMAGVLAHELNRLKVKHEITARPIDALSMGHPEVIGASSEVVSEERKEPDGRGIEGASKPTGSGYVSSYLPEPEPEPFSGTGNREPEHADVPSAAAAAAPRKGTRIPDQFFITDQMHEWAAGEVPGLDLNWYTRKFVDHWRSTTRNATKLDWTRTWQNWMRSEFEKPNHRRVNGRASPPRQSTTDQRVADTLALREKYLAQEQAQERLEIEA